MKTTYINKILLFLLVVLLTTGCSLDDVSVDNGSEFTNKNLVKDGKSANILLNGIYGAFRTEGMVLFPLALMTSGTEQALSTNDVHSVKEFAENNIQVRSTSVSDRFYREASYVINTSNYLITQIEAGKADDLSERRKKEMIGEAKTLRAYARLTMLRVYGEFYDINSKYGIVISNKPIKAQDKYPRKSVKESYDAIIADLEFGVNNNAETKLKPKVTDGGIQGVIIENCYVTKTTAKAFLAKVYLYKKDFEKAQRLAEEIINTNDGGYALETTYEGIYTKKWKSSEVLFAPHKNERLKGFSAIDVGEVYKNPHIFPSNYFKKLANDQVPAVQGDDSYMSGYDPRLVFANKGGDIKSNKYPFPVYGVGNTIYYMRMAEVYLIYAEATARNNHLTKAVTAVNTIRDRANAGITNPDQKISPISSTDKAEILDLIRKEKMLELFAETGETWFDLVRYLEIGDLTFETVKKQKKTLTEKKQLIFPIPFKAMKGSDKLIQNPGY